jgi:hypothetical protein
MKFKNFILSSLLLCFVFTFGSCKKEEAKSNATTGGLVVKVQLAGSTGYLTGVDVGIATSLDNLDNGVYLNEKITNANGKADFGQLNPGNYYYDCYHIIGSDEYYGEGQVQVTAGKNLELTLILE